ncbi:hypothetical protein NP493_299g03068 [Ridgeia piscesae]|uniref:Paraoxonase n=1 Tax=Ridgeia piscesae TaxID=27915 RepID=A0AAD9NW82_RIDPI|nr:hypothetical protein NP493_299g03068 [Ridgeia piscesae]
MLQQIVVVTAVCFIAILCTESVWTYPLLLSARNHQPGRCTLVPGIDHGSEDIQVLPNGLAFISSGLGAQVHGGIFLFDFWKPKRGVRALELTGDIDKSTFSPHGISIWTDTNRNLVYLYVVNHVGREKDTVEKFRLDEKRRTLYHMKTFHDDPTFIHLNNLAVVAEDSFYFTNYFKSDLTLEYKRGLPLGNVGFYDGAKGRILLTELCFPNGIAASPDGRNKITVEKFRLDEKRRTLYHVKTFHDDPTFIQHVYLAISLEKRVNIYTRSSDNTLKLTQVFRLTTSADGLVLQVDEVYHNDGRQFSGATTAVRYRRLMLVGSVYTNLLLCQDHHA